MDEKLSIAIGIAVFAAVLWVLSFPMVWCVAILISMAICAVMTIYSIFTFSLMLALNWFLIGLVLIIPLAIASHYMDR